MCCTAAGVCEVFSSSWSSEQVLWIVLNTLQLISLEMPCDIFALLRCHSVSCMNLCCKGGTRQTEMGMAGTER